ncbi:MerR family transcriptional regulator [Streptomyces sp. DSM 15324]|uniref:MerR family transcriptional regulator n=1 Tax=Streptomyces sp. DSM 15324 TaxID=1739111 RepID=UPI00074988ED|nr:MerR family transcriptional regulator [Streptomyces sp. DSM 15324]KUO09868.1 transcriptional regulator [Streptomyces sp. DSM 15324]
MTDAPGGAASREDVPPQTGVTTGSLARRLGVSPTTLRSWDRRYGLGPATRTTGRHRRWTPGDVDMVLEMCRLTAEGLPPAEAAKAAKAQQAQQAHKTAKAAKAAKEHAGDGDRPARHRARSRDVTTPPAAVPASPYASRSGSGLPLGDVRQECRGLARAAVRMDALAVQERLVSAIRAHGLVVAWEEIMAPALQAVGRKWQSADERYVEVEHLLSWHVSATLRHVYAEAASFLRGTRSSPVLLACLPGEQHTLPLEALNAALAERGEPTLMLGSAVPGEALIAAVRRVGPGAVVLWSQSPSTVSMPLAQHIAATRWGIRGARTQSHVLISGPGWGRSRPPGLLRPRGLGEALDMLQALATRGPDDV